MLTEQLGMRHQGLILGSGCLSVPQVDDQEQNTRSAYLRGATRLLRILVSESAYLIWVLRCEGVIQEKYHSE